MYWDLYGFVMWGMLTFVLRWIFLGMLSGSSGMRSRVNLSFNLEKFKNSSTLKFQSLMANMICRDKREIWDFWCLSFFAGVSWYQGPQKHAQTPLVSSPNAHPFQPKTRYKTSCRMSLNSKKNRDSPSFAEKVEKGLGRPGGFHLGSFCEAADSTFLRLIMSQYPSAAGDPLDLNGWGNAQDQWLWSIGLRLRNLSSRPKLTIFSLGFEGKYSLKL